MRFTAVVEAEYEWDKPLTIEKIREVIEGDNCGVECETITLRVVQIEEVK